MKVSLDIIIPVYNEPFEVVKDTVESLQTAFAGWHGVTIIIVNDGSKAEYGLERLQELPAVNLIEHEQNRGYGQALKTGILSGNAEWIAITDADSTYPVEEFPKLVRKMANHDMVVASRTGQINEMPALRRFPKWFLNRLASYMAGVKINDLNSGMRVFSRRLCFFLWPFYPSGFSFTSTITMGGHMGGFRICEVPVNYFKRVGKSSIDPIRDTIRFFRIILRLGLLFHPMRLFGPVASVVFLLGLGKGLLFDFRLDNHIGNLAVVSMLASLQILMMGLIAKLVVQSRLLDTVHLTKNYRNSAEVDDSFLTKLSHVPIATEESRARPEDQEI